MARRRYQRPEPKKVGNHWQIVVREDVATPDGKIQRRQVRINLGSIEEIATQKQAMRLAEPVLSRVNTCQPRYIVGFAEIAARYQQTILPEMVPSSQAAARSHIKKWLLPFFGVTQIHDITPERVQVFISGMRAQVDSEKTVWNVLMTLRSIWSACLDWGYTTDRIFDRVRLRRPQDAEARFFTLEEVKRIIAASPERLQTFYGLAAETGMRAGELCALKQGDVELEAGVVTARRSVWHQRFKDTKGRRQRRFAISALLAGRLKAMMDSDASGCDLVFHTSNGTPWNADDVVRDKLQPLLKKLGIAPGGMHAFRHFNGSFSMSHGAPAQTVRDRLGHSSLAVTNRYSHGVSADDRSIAERIGRELNMETGRLVQ